MDVERLIGLVLYFSHSRFLRIFWFIFPFEFIEWIQHEHGKHRFSNSSFSDLTGREAAIYVLDRWLTFTTSVPGRPTGEYNSSGNSYICLLFKVPLSYAYKTVFRTMNICIYCLLGSILHCLHDYISVIHRCLWMLSWRNSMVFRRRNTKLIRTTPSNASRSSNCQSMWYYYYIIKHHIEV